MQAVSHWTACRDKKYKPCPGLLKRRKIDGELRFSVLSPYPGEGKGVWG